MVPTFMPPSPPSPAARGPHTPLGPAGCLLGEFSGRFVRRSSTKSEVVAHNSCPFEIQHRCGNSHCWKNVDAATTAILRDTLPLVQCQVKVMKVLRVESQVPPSFTLSQHVTHVMMAFF